MGFPPLRPALARCSAALLALASLAVLPLAGAQQLTLPLWPGGAPEPTATTGPESDIGKPNPAHTPVTLVNVSVPTLTLYQPRHPNGVAALVFPGGGYVHLAYTKEGLDTCEWLNSLGITCLLVKYRIPQPPGEAGHYPADAADLEDAQQAMRLTRAHAAEWRLHPDRIGVVGFSAGGNLAVLLSSHPDDTHVLATPAASQVNPALDARADFAIVVYPAYLALAPDETALNPVYTPNRFTPPTFLIQAEDDKTYRHNAIVYYRALMDAGVSGQLHYYATGGHGFGMHPAGKPEEHWPELAATWLRDIGILPLETLHHLQDSGSSGGNANPTPCQLPQPSQPGQPPRPIPTDPNNPNCY